MLPSLPRARRATALLTSTALAVLGLLAVVAPAPAHAAVDYSGLRINEIQADGSPDWVEVTNTGASPLDISGVLLLDDGGASNNHAFQAFPSGTVVAPGAFVTIDSTVNGLGKDGDAVRLYPPGTASFPASSVPTIDSYSWTKAAGANGATKLSFGRCPDGVGSFTVTLGETKGSANKCGNPSVAINEVETSGPANWVELVNGTGADQSLAGWKITAGAGTYTLPSPSTVTTGSYLAADLPFDLGSSDKVSLVKPDGSTADTYSWTTDAATSYGRCPDASGTFTVTQRATKGSFNNCPGDLATQDWPGGSSVTTVDPAGAFGTNLSGLVYQGNAEGTPGTLWGIKNGPSTLFKIQSTNGVWAPAAGDWAAGKSLHYPDGTGDPDAEGVTFPTEGANAGPGKGIWVSTERNNTPGTVSRPAVLRFDDVEQAGTTLNAVRDYNLTPDLPNLGPNLGLEGVAWVPDSYLVAQGLYDNHTKAPYDPSVYPAHSGGLFLVGVEATGMVYGYVFDEADNGFQQVTSFASGFPAVMDLHWNVERQNLWVACDDTCQGRIGTFGVSGGQFVNTAYYERPSASRNLNNEGFTIASRSTCVNGVEPTFYADDTNDDNHALRQGTIACTPRPAQTVAFTSSPGSPVIGDSYPVSTTGGASGNPVVVSSTTPGVCRVTGSTVSFVAAGTCTLQADQAGTVDTFAPGTATQTFTVGKQAGGLRITSTPSQPTVGGAYAVTTSGAVGAVTLTAGPASVCSISGSTVQLAHAGSCTVTATDTGDAAHTPASYSQTFTVAPAPATLAIAFSSAGVSVTASSTTGAPSGTVTLMPDGGSPVTAPLVGGVATFAPVAPSDQRVLRVTATLPASGDTAAATATATRTAPTVRLALGGRPHHGWYDAPVRLRFSCSAGSAAVTDCPAASSVGEGRTPARTVTVHAADGAVATVSVPRLDVDLTGPAVRIAGGSPGQGRCVAHDGLSGVASCRLTRHRNGRAVVLVARAVDVAGNVTTVRERYRRGR